MANIICRFISTHQTMSAGYASQSTRSQQIKRAHTREQKKEILQKLRQLSYNGEIYTQYNFPSPKKEELLELKQKIQQKAKKRRIQHVVWFLIFSITTIYSIYLLI
jgi:hypothetical protein